jgi:autotransporter-associated beta strand protein
MNGGGGGLGAGGDIFVMAGALLTIAGGGLADGTVTGGLGASGGGNGAFFGGSLFLQGNEAITLAPASGTEKISGVIADETGSGGTGANAGAGSLVIGGAGTVDLAAANTFTGGVTIESGILELANAGAAGSGGITFASSSGEVQYAAGANLANTITGWSGSDKIDFSTVTFTAGDRVVDTTGEVSSGTVSVETSAGQVATFKVSGLFALDSFGVGVDASGKGVLVTYHPSSYLNVSSANQLSADIKAIDLASQAGNGIGTQYVISLAAGGTLTEGADISAINLKGLDTLTIYGQNATQHNGFFVYSGHVTIENLTIADAKAVGGAGGSGADAGGGGAGLGGGLFVGSSANVTPSRR